MDPVLVALVAGGDPGSTGLQHTYKSNVWRQANVCLGRGDDVADHKGVPIVTATNGFPVTVKIAHVEWFLLRNDMYGRTRDLK